MNFSRFLYSLISFIVALFFLILGIFSLLMPWSETLRTLTQQMIEEQMWPMSFFGFAFLLIGIAFAGQILVSCKRQYYTLSVEGNTVEVSEKVLHDYLTDYFSALFPQQEIPCRIAIKKNRLAVVADLPFYPLEERKDLMKRIDREIGIILKDHLGYTSKLNLTLSFPRNKPSK